MMKGKRILPAVLSLLLLCGCAAAPVTPPDLPDPAQLGMVMTEEYNYTLTAEVLELERVAQDERVVATGEYSVPQLHLARVDGTPVEAMEEPALAVQKINRYFTDWRNKLQLNFAEIGDLAEEDCQKGVGEWQSEDYCYTDAVEVSFETNGRLLCVTLWSSSFTGGVHGVAGRSSLTFDLKTGSMVTINDMVKDYVGLRDAVAQEILGQIRNAVLAKYYDDAALFSDYEQTIPEWMSRAVFFEDGQMTVVFSVYDIAPYAAGEQAFTVPYSVITPYLNDYGREVLKIKLFHT